MKRMNRRIVAIRLARLMVLAIGLAPWIFPGRATAQYGGLGGFGFGYGFGYNPNAYADVNYLNQRSLINASAAANSRPQALTAPRFQSRDDGFFDKYDLATRESMVESVARDPGRERGTSSESGIARRPTTTTTGRSIPPPPAEVHLADYFSKDNHLVWPSSAPISGELGKKQAVADLAILAVLNEYNMKGLAQLSTVTDARQKLVDYGRPALKSIQQTSTPALAESFHVFLLALYSNLGNAATVPKAR